MQRVWSREIGMMFTAGVVVDIVNEHYAVNSWSAKR